jgi:hypothetical protein
MKREDLGQVIECLRRVAADQRSNTKQANEPPPPGASEAAPCQAEPEATPPAKPANIGGIIQPY